MIGGASKLHMLLTFFAVLGDIQFVGLVGIVAGPLEEAISTVLLEHYWFEQFALVISSTDS